VIDKILTIMRSVFWLGLGST